MATPNYRREAQQDAARLALHYLDEIVEQILKKGSASDQLYRDYEHGDEALDRYRGGGYSLHECADVLEQLSEYEADDNGLWHDLAPREAISVMTAETYANAVYELWRDLIDNINNTVDEDEQDFKVGPKEWSPHGTGGKLKEFVKDFIQSGLVED